MQHSKLCEIAEHARRQHPGGKLGWIEMIYRRRLAGAYIVLPIQPGFAWVNTDKSAFRSAEPCHTAKLAFRDVAVQLLATLIAALYLLAVRFIAGPEASRQLLESLSRC